MVCKILGRIVKVNILQYLKTVSILSDAQHGFMPRRSCLTNLIVAEELITGMIDVVYLDFSKPIDSVCHRLLVNKMEAMWIHVKITRWVDKFLKSRTFRVKLGGHLSSEAIVKSGVHQGPVLGPFLFLILINDLENERNCNDLSFADDVKQHCETTMNSTSTKLAS